MALVRSVGRSEGETLRRHRFVRSGALQNGLERLGNGVSSRAMGHVTRIDASATRNVEPRARVARLGLDRGEEALQETLLAALRHYDDLRDGELRVPGCSRPRNARSLTAHAASRAPLATDRLDEHAAAWTDPDPTDDVCGRVLPRCPRAARGRSIGSLPQTGAQTCFGPRPPSWSRRRRIRVTREGGRAPRRLRVRSSGASRTRRTLAFMRPDSRRHALARRRTEVFRTSSVRAARRS